jgi:hypothetical protein
LFPRVSGTEKTRFFSSQPGWRKKKTFFFRPSRAGERKKQFFSVPAGLAKEKPWFLYLRNNYAVLCCAVLCCAECVSAAQSYGFFRYKSGGSGIFY